MKFRSCEPCPDPARGVVAFSFYLLGLATVWILLLVHRGTQLVAPTSWIDKPLHLDKVTEVLHKAIAGKKKRAVLELCLSIALVSAIGCVTWQSSPLIWQYWINSTHSRVWIPPILNESIVVIQCALTTVVFVAVTAMLHFTGILKWLRILCAKMWYDIFFVTCGDPRDNTFVETINVKISRIRDDVEYQLGPNVSDIRQAEKHPNWRAICARVSQQIQIIEEDAKYRAMNIADDTVQRVNVVAKASVCHAIQNEQKYVTGSIPQLRNIYKLA